MRMPRFLAALLARLDRARRSAPAAARRRRRRGASSSTDVNELLDADVHGRQGGRLRQARRWPSRSRRRARAPTSCRARSSSRSTGPFDAPDEESTAEVRARGRASRARGQSLTRARPRPATRAIVSFQGTDYVRRRPGLPAVQDAVRAGARSRPRAAGPGPELRHARHGPAQVARPTRRTTARRRSATPTRSRSPAASTWTSCSTTSTRRSGRPPRSARRRARQIPEKLTEEQKRQVDRGDQGPADRDLHGQGRQDPAPARARRLGIEDATGGLAARSRFDVSITDLNEDQDIAEPQDAQPFDELLGQLGGLGALGGGARLRLGLGQRRRGSRRRRAPDERLRGLLRVPRARPATTSQKARECADLLAP